MFFLNFLRSIRKSRNLSQTFNGGHNAEFRTGRFSHPEPGYEWCIGGIRAAYILLAKGSHPLSYRLQFKYVLPLLYPHSSHLLLKRQIRFGVKKYKGFYSHLISNSKPVSTNNWPKLRVASLSIIFPTTLQFNDSW